jgi:hypothetical protein
MECEKALIDQTRLHLITEFAVIDGGEFADVLAVSYGVSETRIRLRFEESGNRIVFGPRQGEELRETLDLVADLLFSTGRYRSKPEVTLFRGKDARRCVRRLLEEIQAFAEAGSFTGSEIVRIDMTKGAQSEGIDGIQEEGRRK